MTFLLHELLHWLDDASVTVRLQRADGSPLESLPRDLRLREATLDSRRAGPDVLFCGVQGESQHGGHFLPLALIEGSPAALIEGALRAVPGSSVPVLVVDDGREALRAAARGWLHQVSPAVVGITGSNGKTTTKDMLRAALSGPRKVGANPGNLNSGWGLPLAVLGQETDLEVLVLEMGASAPDEIGRLASLAEPRVGCVTNVAPAHLEQFGTVDAVERTKGQLLEALPADGLAVLPRDDARHDRLAARTAARTLSFGQDPRADVRLEECEQLAEGLRVRIQGVEATLPVFGRVNGWNAAAAVAMASAFGVEPRAALDGIARTDFSPHRSRLLRAGGRTLLDDCYNANPASMRAALESLAALPGPGRRVAVLGDMAELGADAPSLHREVLEHALGLGLDAVYLPGSQMRAAATADARLHPHEGDVASLARTLAQHTRAHDALLFKGSRSAALERVLDALLPLLTESDGEDA